MARVFFDPAVRSFSGRLGGFVYYQNRSVPCVRRYVVPYNPGTPRQKKVRMNFAEAVRLWQKLPSYKKDQWNKKGIRRQRCGYNLFLSSCLQKSICDGSSVQNRLSDSSFFLFAGDPLRLSAVLPAGRRR